MRVHDMISKLERELNSEVVIQEAVIKIGECRYDQTRPWDNQANHDEPDEIVYPEITEPNIEARIKARIELINLKYTLWFFQYKARERIDELLLKQKSKDEIELEEFYNQIEDLERGLRAEIVVQEEEGYSRESTAFRVDDPKYDPDKPIIEFIETKPKIIAPDLQKREASIRELKKLYEETRYKTAKSKIENVLGYAPGEKNENP